MKARKGRAEHGTFIISALDGCKCPTDCCGHSRGKSIGGIARAERDGTRAETRIRLFSKRTIPFKSVGSSVQSTAGSRGVRIGFSNDGYTTLGGGLRVLATHSIRQFPLHFPSRASPCATRFRTSSTHVLGLWNQEPTGVDGAMKIKISSPAYSLVPAHHPEGSHFTA